MDSTLRELLTRHNQDHIIRHLELMSKPEQQALIADLGLIDLEQAANLHRSYSACRDEPPEKKQIEAVTALNFNHSQTSRQERKRLYGLGEDFLSQGRVALFLVAGGQGSRLGFEGPKGCYGISPIKGKSLFQLFAETVRALQQRYGRALPWYILTSQENNAVTRDFFEKHDCFGLKNETVRFLIQQQIPSLDRKGRLIVSPDKKIFKNPNGHGGSLSAMHAGGALEEMSGEGIEEIFYFQVDNPLVRIADPLFIGAHLENRAEMSSKVVRKVDPCEKVGVLGRINGRLGCIEYSELSEHETREQTAEGHLRFGSANIAVHLLNRGFVERLTCRPDFTLPYHVAVKEIQSLTLNGKQYVQQTIEGLKFEMFIFDALGFADRSATLEVPRSEEFSPVKNREGTDSPATARRAMIDLHTGWLRQTIPEAALPADLIVEISPLLALNADEAAESIRLSPPIRSPLYLGSSKRFSN